MSEQADTATGETSTTDTPTNTGFNEALKGGVKRRIGETFDELFIFLQTFIYFIYMQVSS